ncbi:MAG: hypothetical protein ABI333_27545 [bacterium]
MTNGEPRDKLQITTQLFDSYRQDQAVGILDARMAWEELDDEVLIIAAGWAGSAEQELAASDTAALFGAGGYDWAFYVEAQNTIGFHRILEAVQNHRGDPPASAPMRRYALDILRGRVHLSGAIRLVSADAELASSLPDLYQTFLPGIDPRRYPILNQAVRVAAAMALPRVELYRLRGIQSDDEATPSTALDARHLEEIREAYQAVMLEAASRKDEEDHGREEELLVRALDLATQSPEPDDDIEVMQRILQLAEQSPISTGAITRCASALQDLVTQGHRSVAVANCLIALGQVVQRQGLLEEIGEIIVGAGSRLLEEELEREVELNLKTTVARAWLGLGRTERARPLLKEVDDVRLGPEDRLNVALMTAETHQEKQRSGKAADALLAALEMTRDVEPTVRLPALQKLLSVWPDSRELEGLLPYVDELLETAKTMTEPRRTLCLVGTALRLWPAGRRVQALRAWSMIDEDRIRRETPPMMAEKVLSVVEKARLKMDTSQSQTVVH